MSEPRLRWGFGALSVFLLLTGVLVASSSNPAGGQEQRRAVKPQREPIRVGGNVQESKLVHRVEPVYPPEARAARISGVVILQVTVNEAGDVSDARTLRGHPLLDAAAMEAVRQWRYSPTLLNGEPVPELRTSHTPERASESLPFEKIDGFTEYVIPEPRTGGTVALRIE